MNDPVQQLVDDHINLSIVHRHLREQMEIFQTRYTSENVLLLIDIVDYLKSYPEFLHHGIEDKIYHLMRYRISEQPLIQFLDEIESQHGQLRVLSQRLQSGLQAVAQDQVIDRNIIVSDYLAYIALYEEHIHNENTRLLPIVEHYLREEELEKIGNEMLDTPDPLFSATKAQVFQHLFEHITDTQLLGAH